MIKYLVWDEEMESEANAIEIEAHSAKDAAEEYCYQKHSRGSYHYATDGAERIMVRKFGEKAPVRFAVEPEIQAQFYAVLPRR